MFGKCAGLWRVRLVSRKEFIYGAVGVRRRERFGELKLLEEWWRGGVRVEFRVGGFLGL